jgi:large repetitive protein
MFDSFDNLGNVNIQFVPFSSNASKSQWFIDDKDGANDYLNGITPNGGTYYDTALEKTVDDYDPPGADKTLVYFISDGEPTDGHKISATEKANWESFIETNKVDIAFGIGITDNVNLDSLTPIAYPNTNEDGDLDPYAIQVVNAFDLQQTLLETVSEGIVRGDISVLNESVDGGIVIGADGGHIQSIMADGVLHEYDPVSNQTESVTTNRGGTISINYETGEYYYIINPKNTVSGEQETFVVTAADNDGDTTSVDLVIHLDYLATLDANSDRIITNTAEGDSLSIAHDMLLANDAGSSQVTIDNITPDAGTDLTTSPDEITLTDLADGENFTYQITAEGVSDSARVEVVRVDAAQLHGTSGDDILINSSSATLSDAAPALYGEEGDDYLQGSNGDEIFDGGEGRDTIDAGDGDDTIVFDRADAHIDGGNGLDTLLIADDALDFSVLRDGTIENIEKIDLSGSAAQRVSLTLDDVLDMTGVENVLEVRGEAGDTVAIDVTGWTQDENNSGLFSKGGDIVSIVSSADSDNAIHIDYTDDGTEVG